MTSFLTAHHSAHIMPLMP